MFSIEWAKSNFFDRDVVIRAIGEARTAVLSRMGAFVQRRAQTSMRRRKRGSSKPGQPPFARQGDLRDRVLFAFDSSTDTGVVGPVGWAGSDVPALHEFGGQRVAKYSKQVVVRGTKGRRLESHRVEAGQTINYPPRPYMGPALERERAKFPALFRDSIRAVVR